MSDAFYLPRGAGRYLPTGHTAGPWSPDSQHFGPPSALLVREFENVPAQRDMLLGRVTVEILGPAPLAELTVRARLERPGRSVELLSAELGAGGRVVAKATAWRFATSDTTKVAEGSAGPLTPVEDCPPADWPTTWNDGYLKAMEWRKISGGIIEPGPAAVWVRQRVALVDGEKPSPLQRLFTVADSGNGAANRLDMGEWLFINAELTVHVHREPVGEWIGLDADTVLGPQGAGTATSRLHDTSGQVGTGAQALLVRARPDRPPAAGRNRS